MKHVFYLCSLILLCLGLGSCANDELIEDAGVSSKIGTFTAYLPGTTRTSHEGLKTYWQENDQIALYSVSAIDTDATPIVYSVVYINDDGSAVFQGPALSAEGNYTAMYPYVEGKTLNEAKDYILENQHQISRFGESNLRNTDILVASTVSAATEEISFNHDIALIHIRTIASRISRTDGLSVRGAWGDRVYYLKLSGIGSSSDYVDAYVAVPSTPEYFGEVYITYYKNGEAIPSKYTMPRRIPLSKGQILVMDMTVDSWPTQTATSLPHYQCSGVKNGHEYVEVADIKWACTNVGAMFPWEKGGFYAWGETRTKAQYSDDNYDFTGMTVDDLKSAGVIDEDNNLTSLYDVASQEWGSGWQMPTIDQFKAITNNEYENRILGWNTPLNEMIGVTFEDTDNSGEMFLPCQGFRFLNLTFGNGGGGYYWSKDLQSADSDLMMVYCLVLNINSMYNRCSEQQSPNGMFVRPVLSE